MYKILSVCILAASLVGCSAPQGTKLASTQNLPPVASGPATNAANLTWINKGTAVNLINGGTLTVMLESIPASGNAWRLAQIPDPTVLKVASHEYLAPESATPQGTEKWVFQAVGPGDIKLSMWYGKIGPAPLDEALNFNCTVSVEEAPVKPTKHSKHTKHVE